MRMTKFDPFTHSWEWYREQKKIHKNDSQIAFANGIGRKTLHNWKKKFSKYKLRINNITHFYAWMDAHPENRHFNYFQKRKNNPRRPEDSTVMKVIEVLREADDGQSI